MGATPSIVFGLADPRWLVWLPEFLVHPAYEHRCQLLERGGATATVSTSELCILLSDHHSLRHDDPAGARALTQGPAVVQPRAVADLAYDKRCMASVARQVPGLRVIPELSAQEARDWLASGSATVVIKRNDGTEGRDLSVVAHVADFGAALSRYGQLEDVLIQPFVGGIEYSVNVVSGPRGHRAFEPVCKGSSSVAGTHPCRRLRHCPCSALTDGMRLRLVQAGLDLASAIGSQGLLEIEFIAAADALWFLELNPRLSATMRMASIACDRSIFAELALSRIAPSWEGGVASAVRFAAELPIAPGTNVVVLRHLSASMPLWVSSRVTTAADRAEVLRGRLVEVAAALGLADALAVPEHAVWP